MAAIGISAWENSYLQTQRGRLTFEFRWRGRWHAARAGPSPLRSTLSRAHQQRIVGGGFGWVEFYLRSRVVPSITLGIATSLPDIDFLKASTTSAPGDDNSPIVGALLNLFCLIRRPICLACKTSAKPLPKKKNAGIKRSSHKRLLTELCVALRITATIKKPSPMMTLPMPLPVNSSGSFDLDLLNLSTTLSLCIRFCLTEISDELSKSVPHFRQNRSSSPFRFPHFEQDITFVLRSIFLRSKVAVKFTRAAQRCA